MPVTPASYGTLKTDVANWLARTDLTALIPKFIEYGLARVNDELAANGGIPDQDNMSFAVTTAGSEILLMGATAHEGRVRGVWLGDDLLLEADYNRLVDAYGGSSGPRGKPQAYAIYDYDKMLLRPVPDQGYSIQWMYAQRYLMFSNDNDSNFLLLNGGPLLLYAALTEAEGVLYDDPRIQTWGAMYDRAMQRFLKAHDRAKKGPRPVPLMVDPALTGAGAFSIAQGL